MIITENMLHTWVRSYEREAQGVIVELVWRLIAASVPSPNDCRFPLGDSIGQHGFDGDLDVNDEWHPFVPSGRSFWEIGVGLDAQKKATLDYNDSIKNVPIEIRRNSTFIFVTPNSALKDWEYTWKGDSQIRWIETRKKRNDWKNIRIIDGTKLIDWMHRFPAVEYWFAHRTNYTYDGQIEISAQRWRDVRRCGAPPELIPEVFIAGREKAVEEVQQIFKRNKNRLNLKTHFPDQFVNFIIACLENLPLDERLQVEGRCLIISGEATWNRMIECRENLILIADPKLDLSGDAGTRLIQRTLNANHKIIFSSSVSGIPDPTSLHLSLPEPDSLRSALVKAGYTEERARVLVQKSGTNLGSLMRCLQNLSYMPEWSQNTDASQLKIAIILGSWSDQSESDRSIIEEILGNSLGEWIGKMRKIALYPNTPLIHQHGQWRFIMRYEGWYALGSSIFADDLERLLSVAKRVLGAEDPQFELESDQRYAARLHGKVLPHSHMLRTGIAESLALLGSHPKALTECGPGKAETVAVLAVRALLAEAPWKRWASLTSLLPLLAEAAPEEFLTCVENALERESCPFDEVLAQESEGFTGRRYIHGLLWALETLAWDAALLCRVVVCLGELAKRRPSDHRGNSPENSLETIFLPWLPQTCATVEQRKNAVLMLLSDFPEIGWKLLMSLLNPPSVSSGTHKPIWRDVIPNQWSKNVFLSELYDQSMEYSKIAILHVGINKNKLIDLIDRLAKVPVPAKDLIMVHLGSDEVLGLPEIEKFDLWNHLRSLVSKHREFSGAEWAMRTDTIEKLSSIMNQFEPQSLVLRYRGMFGEHGFDLPDKPKNYEEQIQCFEKHRQNALKEIIAAGDGFRAVVDLAKAVESPWRVGVTYGSLENIEIPSDVLSSLIISAEKFHVFFAGGFIKQKFITYGFEWVDKLGISHWTREQIGQFLSFLSFSSETWKRAEHLLRENVEIYWNKASVNQYEVKSEEDLKIATAKLLQHGRPNAALQCAYFMIIRKQTVDQDVVMEALANAFQVPSHDRILEDHQLTKIIKSLQKNPNINIDQMLHIEFMYLQLLDRHYGAYPKLLENRLAQDPEFFIEMIKIICLPRKENQNETETAAQNGTEIVAKNAYRLLNDWAIPPGSQKDGIYDGEALNQWIEKVRTSCPDERHLRVAMAMLSEVLIYAPADPDGLWMHRTVATVLNNKTAKSMRHNFCIALFNSRGAREFDSTGQQEKRLAEEYRNKAQLIENAGYHRLATELRELAKDYDRESERVASGRFFDN